MNRNHLLFRPRKFGLVLTDIVFEHFLIPDLFPQKRTSCWQRNG
jgi:hypothetical protein